MPASVTLSPYKESESLATLKFGVTACRAGPGPAGLGTVTRDRASVGLRVRPTESRPGDHSGGSDWHADQWLGAEPHRDGIASLSSLSEAFKLTESSASATVTVIRVAAAAIAVTVRVRASPGHESQADSESRYPDSRFK